MGYMGGDQLLDNYVDCDSLPQAPSGDFVGTMTHPSGASGSFTTQFRQIGRTDVGRLCTYYPWGGYLAWTNGSIVPKSLVSQSLISKVITGVGLSPLTWQYADYSDPWGEWAPCSVCSDGKIVTVTDPQGEVTRYTYGIRWRVNEGQLLKVEEGWNGNSAPRTTTYSYRDAAGQAFPHQTGESMLGVGDYLSWHNRPLQTKITSQQGVEFNWRVDQSASGFDALARPLRIDRYSSLGYAVSDSIVYYDNTAKWVLGQVATVSTAGEESERTDFDTDTAMPSAKYSFGRLLYRLQYNGDGAVQQRLDPVGRPTVFLDYFRGVPRSIVASDGTTQSASVSNIGAITSYTNAFGTTTSYGYDAMGRLARIDEPAEGWGSYHPTLLTFEQVNQDEFGISGGHWRQTIATGNERSVRYFDALWRVGLTRTFDAADEAGTSSVVENHYDPSGRTVFQSQPQRSIASIGSGVPGKTWFYDGVGRLQAQREDSEIGQLNTVTEYLANFQRRTTNPRGIATTTAFQAFDTPSEDAIADIWAPEGVTVHIDRDVFGKPTAITRSGPDWGSGPAGVSRALVYDANQRLCKTVEPETGATVLFYDAAGNIAWRAAGQPLPARSCDQASVADASKASFSYDARNRLVGTVYGDGSESIGRSYTPDGLLASAWTPDKTWTYSYNNRRLLVQETLGYDALYGIGRDYDANGHLSQLRYPDSSAVAYAPDALGQPTRVGSYASNVTHHPNGAVAGYTLGNGIVHTLSLNARGLPLQNRDAGVLQDQYAFDASGNVSAITDQQEGITSRSMVYDGIDRLIVADAPNLWGTGRYYYDALDNLRWAQVGARTTWISYDANNRIAYTNTNGTYTSYGYNMRGDTVVKGAQQFYFDLGNRMAYSVAGATVAYGYDGLGRRTITLPADYSYAHTYVYSQAGELLYGHDYHGPSYDHTLYVYLDGKLIAENGSLGLKYFHTDALGSPVATSSPSGQLLTRTRTSRSVRRRPAPIRRASGSRGM